MTNAFEYGDALLPRDEGEDEASTPTIGNNQPYLNLATFVVISFLLKSTNVDLRFRMVVLADEILESFFDTDLSASFKLEQVENTIPPSNSGFLSGLLSTIVTDDNKKIFNRFTDEIGKTIGKHQVTLLYHTPPCPILLIYFRYRSSIAHPLVDKCNYKNRRRENPYLRHLCVGPPQSQVFRQRSRQRCHHRRLHPHLCHPLRFHHQTRHCQVARLNPLYLTSRL